MSKLSDYLTLKKQVEQLQTDADRAEGALDQLLSQLKKEFGCKSLKEARILLRKLTTELEQLEHDSRTKITAFEEKWSERLRGVQRDD